MKTPLPSEGSRAAIYARVSMPKQKSVPVQIDLCRAECDRRGIRAAYILKDEGISAKTEDRPGYQRILDLVAEQQVDAVVTWKLDRLVRSMRHFVDFAALLDEAGVSLISLTEQVDTSSAFGRYNFRNLASMAELEREIIGERAQLGRYRMASEGRWPNKIAPIGYELDAKNNIKPNKREAAIVRQIFTWYKQGMSMTEITRRLHKRGVTGRHGRPLAPSSIHYIVRNPIYVGRPKIMDIEHHRPDLRLIRDATFEAVQARFGRRCTDNAAARRRKAAMDNVYEDYLHFLDASDGLEGHVH